MNPIDPRERIRPDRTPTLPSTAAWIGLCAAAEAVGLAAAAAAAKAGSAPAVPAPAALALVVGGGLVEGSALGTAQATGLRGLLPPPARHAWVLVTLVVAGLGWAGASAPAVLAPGGGPEPPLGLILAGAAALGAVLGAVLGGAQAWVLRTRVAHPWRWVTANTLAWAAAMPVIFLGATSPSADWSIAAVLTLAVFTGLAGGAVLGAVSGWFLPSLRGESPG